MVGPNDTRDNSMVCQHCSTSWITTGHNSMVCRPTLWCVAVSMVDWHCSTSTMAARRGTTLRMFCGWTLWLFVSTEFVEVVYGRRRRSPKSLVAGFADRSRTPRGVACQRYTPFYTPRAVYFTATPTVMLYPHIHTSTLNSDAISTLHIHKPTVMLYPQHTH